MREPRRTRDGRWTRVIALVVGLAAVLAMAEPALAFDLQPEPHAFGMVGLARSQRAVLNAVQTQPSTDPDRGVCEITLSFVDAGGQTFRDPAGNEVKQTFVLRGSQAVMIGLRASDILGETGRRKPIRPVTATNSCACVGVVATWEIVSPGGAATSTGELGYRSPNPPDPPGGCVPTAR